MWLHAFALVGLGLIFWQDAKDRMVHWALFPLTAIFLGLAHWHSAPTGPFMAHILANALLVSTVLSILWLHARYVAQKAFLNVSFGLGDVLFLYAMAMGFPTVTFTVLFSGAILFALLLHLGLGMAKKQRSVPLAGHMGLFLMVALVLSHLVPDIQLYRY